MCPIWEQMTVMNRIFLKDSLIQWIIQCHFATDFLLNRFKMYQELLFVTKET